jgi:diguanylate cyclase (GGDEF)-like protein
LPLALTLATVAALTAALTAPAYAQSALDPRIAELRELTRFVPEQSLAQLQHMESEARQAPPRTRAEFISQLSIAHMRLGQNRDALALAEEVVAYGRAQKNDAILAKGLLTKAYALSAMAENTAAHELAYLAENLAGKGDDPLLQVQAMVTAGQSRAEEGNYPAALIKLQQGVELAHQLDSPVTLAAALNALAVLYDQMKEYDKGFEVLDETIKVAERIHSLGRLAIAKNAEYGLAIDSNQPQRALKASLAALELGRQLGAKRMIDSTLVNLSDGYLREHDYPKALRFASEALAAARENRDSGNEAPALINIGEAYMGMGRLAEGKKSFEAGIAYYDKTGDKPRLQDVTLEYGTALERAGDLTGAIAAYHRERAISNELFEKQRQKSVYELQEKYEAEKKQRRIELLSRDNQVKSAEIDNHRLQQRIWWLLALVFALVSCIVGLLYRKVRQTNAQLEVKNLELKQQSSRDPLTALYNRRHFQEFMRNHPPERPLEKRGAGVSGEELVGALFLLDVDHFKHINDSHGHAAGDAVLKMIAENLAIVMRETDMIVRWGGEEFLAFLPAIPRSGIDDIARRILNGISSQKVPYQDQLLSVNVSVGFSPYPLAPGDEPLSWERAVNLVDMALYLAKAHGRNRAYGVRGFDNFEHTTMEAIEQDLERAWRAGYVDLSVVLGGAGDTLPPEPVGKAAPSNVVALKTAKN